jgi:hypothetical protein
LGVIVSTLDKSPIPESLPFHCLLLKAGKSLWPMPLGNEEWAHVKLAEIWTDQISMSGLAIVRDNALYDIHIPKSGVVVELTIKASPPVKAGPIKKRFQVRETRACHIEVTDIRS